MHIKKFAYNYVRLKKGRRQIFMTLINWATSCVTVIIIQKVAIMLIEANL